MTCIFSRLVLTILLKWETNYLSKLVLKETSNLLLRSNYNPSLNEEIYFDCDPHRNFINIRGMSIFQTYFLSLKLRYFFQ